VKPDIIISSPALRAHTTAQIFAQELGYNKEIHINPDIYEAYIDDVLNVIHHISDDVNTAMIFGHNPTFTNLANYFHNEYIPNVPTCGIVCIECKVDKWSDVYGQSGTLTSFEYPKLFVKNGV
jgi:phosphohistidine phosphatase